MGARGPQPKPTAIKRLTGNPSRRRIAPDEPKPRPGLAVPALVAATQAAAEEWKRAVEAMPPGFFTAADAPVLTVYCLAWVMFQKAINQVALDGMTSKGSMDQTIAHPMLSVARQQSEIILRASGQLGMSPAARVRLTDGGLADGQGGKQEVDPTDRFFADND